MEQEGISVGEQVRVRKGARVTTGNEASFVKTLAHNMTITILDLPVAAVAAG